MGAGNINAGQARLAVITIAALVVTACSGGTRSVDPESMTIAGAEVVAVPDGPAYVAPDGSAWLFGNDDELCVGGIARPEDEPRCAPWGSSVSTTGVSWSADAKRVVFAQDYRRTGEDPDVNVVDVDTGHVDVLTDDSVAEVDAGGADTDVAPFFGPDDEVYFFRLSGNPGARTARLYRLSGGVAEPVDGGDIGDRLPDGTPILWDDNTWVFSYQQGDASLAVATLSFAGAAVAIEEVWTPPGPAVLLDASPGKLLIWSSDPTGLRRSFAVLVPNDRVRLELPVDTETLGEDYKTAHGRFSPDGDYVLEVRSKIDAPVRMTVWKLGENDRLPDAEPLPVDVAAGATPGNAVRFVPGQLGWDGDTNLVEAADSGVVAFEVTARR